jgi:hypothetical protein
LNEETFKAAIIELLRCTSDTNVQRHYFGDGEGNIAVAGFCLPPAALTDGTKPGAETLFKLSLHEVKGLFESQVYLKNPNAADVAAAWIQAAILDGIGCVTNGQPAPRCASDNSTRATSRNTSTNSSITNNNDPSPTNNTPDDYNKDNEKKKKISPAAAMAEASLMSQKAAMLEQDNFKAMLDLQREEAALTKETQMAEMQLNVEEQRSTTKLFQQMVERLCPEEDPTDCYPARKRKLDEMRGVIGEELYANKMEQLKEEFKRATAM